MPMFFRTPFFLPWIYPYARWRMATAEPEIFLTFDDGPVPGPTDFVLEELGKRDVRATFFCIGDNVRKHPDLFRRVVNEGHAVGNHTFHHLNGWRTPTPDYLNDVLECQEEFARQWPVATPPGSPPLFRPPYGRIKKAQAKGLAGYRLVMWDILTFDYNGKIPREKCLRGAIRAVRPGSIVVFHDSYKAERNLTYAFPRFMDHCLEQGYSFKAITNS
jgi:peptidoglycan/xylan/chitin deacetylase (PgdA/CDA1 family)